jgi:hypothetical protein
VRDQALSLACRRFGFEESHGRGFDRLPQEVLDAFAGALVGSLMVEDLKRALACATAGLLREAGAIIGVPGRVQSELEEFCRPAPG